MTEPRKPDLFLENGRGRMIFSANALFLLAGVGLVIFSLFAGEIGAFLSRTFGMKDIDRALTLSAMYYLPFLLLPCALVIARRDAEHMRLTGIGLGMTLTCVAIAPACLLLSTSVTSVWVMLLAPLGLEARTAMPVMANANDLVTAIIAVGVLPGIFEEMLFRGVMLRAYETGGTRRAIFLTALLFALLHGSVEGFPAQFIAGVVLGIAVVSTGSIYAGIMIHTAYNAAQLMLNYVISRAVLDPGAAEYTGAETGYLAVIIGAILMGLVGYGFLRMLLRVLKRHREENGIQLTPPTPLRLTASEIIVLISGLVTTLFLYADGIFHILGYLA